MQGASHAAVTRPTHQSSAWSWSHVLASPRRLGARRQSRCTTPLHRRVWSRDRVEAHRTAVPEGVFEPRGIGLSAASRSAGSTAPGVMSSRLRREQRPDRPRWRTAQQRTPAGHRPRSRRSRSSPQVSSRRRPGPPRPTVLPTGKSRPRRRGSDKLQTPHPGRRTVVVDEPLASREGHGRVVETVLHHHVHGLLLSPLS